MTTYESRREPSAGNKYANSLILDFAASIKVREELLLLISHPIYGILL
jgi:hypothetical protein